MNNNSEKRYFFQENSNGTAIETVALSDSTFENWRKFIYEGCGIYFQDNKKYLLENRLAKRLRALSIRSYEEYLDYMKYNPKRNIEKTSLYDEITINETFFFRNQPQIDAIINKILPEIILEKSKTSNNKIKIWSAASSTGDEAYSLAIAIKESRATNFPEFSYEIIGTDINETALETAKNGVYTEYSVRNTPQPLLNKYFKKENGLYYLDPKIRTMVNFKSLNLYDTVEMSRMVGFNIIICANVLIYFDNSSKKKVVASLHNSLNRYGYLFIGYSETLQGISDKFSAVSFPKTIGYKKD
jgi:chemotaxis protein methyltransferase CheR